ncbi:MAG: carbohydrate binding family 9 domain-containing protein [Ignavibacteria bacterium]|nr:carbohydrate binding family 9 domain-containing protein [Ignavibacteria bacterium]
MKITIACVFICAIFFAMPTSVHSEIYTRESRYRMEAVRVTATINVDGILSEPEWQRAGTSNFTQREPIENAVPTNKTEVWIGYDNEVLYVAARMHDLSPDSITTRIGRRDADLNSDWLYFSVDSYNDKRTAFYFGVNPSSSICDGIIYNDSWADDSWDGVWDAASQIDGNGWSVEMKIPYSQLRFSKQDEYVWGINFMRKTERYKEEDYLVATPQNEVIGVSKSAELIGIKNILPPTKLEILPYIVGSATTTNQFSEGDPFNDGSTQAGNIGADIKFGIGNNLTLNATINPDFGQVEVDPAVVNLSQFEIFFQEKRPFFIEGSTFFDFARGGANHNFELNWGNPDFFYSRRIGRSPKLWPLHDPYGENFVDIPSYTTILGAAKLTGKIADNWSLGVVSATTQREYATVKDANTMQQFHDVVEPLASYNILRTKREFEDGKYAFGIISTSVIRDLNEPYLIDEYNKRAFTLGVDGWTTFDTEKEWVITGWTTGSRVEGTTRRMIDMQRSPLRYYQRPDAKHLGVDSSATSLSGYAGRFAVNKQKGNWSFNSAVGFISPGFESNDLGFQFRADIINMHIFSGYQWYESDGIFRRKGFNAATFRNYDFDGVQIGEGYFIFYNAQTLGFWHLNGNIMMQSASFDNQQTRGGPLFKTTNFYGKKIRISTDSRKEIVVEFGIFAGRSESGGWHVSVESELEWKPSSNISLQITPGFTRDVTMAQWIPEKKFENNPVPDSLAQYTFGNRYVFGKLDQTEFSSSIRMDYTFTPKLTLQLYIQPLISVGSYNKFKELKKPATYTFNNYGENGSTISYNAGNDKYTVDPDGSGAAEPFVFSNPNFNFKSLRGNAVLRWEFLPGSTMYLVWTRGSENYDDAGNFSFGRDLKNLLGKPNYENVFLMKFSYWWNPS